MNGKIMKALSGFYYVTDGEKTITCKPRGKFRRQAEAPLVGDNVVYSLSEPHQDQGTIEQILPRRNCLIRPAVANVDALVILVSGAIPITEPFLIDRMTVIAERQNILPILCVNKTDLDPARNLLEIYRNVGYPVVSTSAATGEGIEMLQKLIAGKTVAFTGNSGVGKSAVLSRLCPELKLQTGEVSQKLGRGRHTTRHIELYPIGGGTLVADTPGFSSFDLETMDRIPKQDLAALFPEFRPLVGKCRFQDCSHRAEPDCAILAALREGMINASRHQSYQKLYAQSEQLKSWEIK